VVDVGQFLANVLPPVDHERLEAVRANLPANLITDSCWTLFPTNPDQCSEHETHLFAPLLELWNAIISHMPADIQTIVEMKNNPSHKKISERAHSIFPDGSLKLISSKTTLIAKPISDQLGDLDAWEDIIVTIEYKKKDNPTTRHNASRLTYHCRIHKIIHYVSEFCQDYL
jgi:hypothetical protein